MEGGRGAVGVAPRSQESQRGHALPPRWEAPVPRKQRGPRRQAQRNTSNHGPALGDSGTLAADGGQRSSRPGRGGGGEADGGQGAGPAGGEGPGGRRRYNQARQDARAAAADRIMVREESH
jgi:hypothetical protein